jgi:Fe2+ or Zn2+ uptake regulation protein
MTETSGSKHAIVCDNCQKVFYFEKDHEEHICKPTKVHNLIRPPNPECL